jgi:hypothetical protein
MSRAIDAPAFAQLLRTPARTPQAGGDLERRDAAAGG